LVLCRGWLGLAGERADGERDGGEEKASPRKRWVAGLAFSEIGGRCRAPRGARGLKHSSVPGAPAPGCRAPRGARGLKPGATMCIRWTKRVAPRAGSVD